MSFAVFNNITHEIYQLETAPPKFSDIDRGKLARTMSPVNLTMDAFLDKAVGHETKEKAFFLIYQLKRLFPHLTHLDLIAEDLPIRNDFSNLKRKKEKKIPQKSSYLRDFERKVKIVPIKGAL